MCSHVEHEHDPFIKRVSRVDSNLFNFNLQLIYKLVNRVEFAGLVRFCQS